MRAHFLFLKAQNEHQVGVIINDNRELSKTNFPIFLFLKQIKNKKPSFKAMAADDQRLLASSYGTGHDAESADYVSNHPSEVNPKCTRWTLAAFVILGAAVIGLLVGIIVLVAKPSQVDETFGKNELAGRMKLSSMMATLQQFEQVALASVSSRSPQGTRSVGSQGYELSAQYVESKLNQTGKWIHQRQYFFGPVYTEYVSPTLSLTSPFSVQYQLATDFTGMRYGGNGSFVFENLPVSLIANGGCSQTDWAGFTAGTGAYALGGLCTSYQAALLAEAAGASAFFIYSRGLSTARVRAVDWTPESPVVSIPTISITTSVAQSWMGYGAQLRVNLAVNNSFDVYETFNILATYVGNGKQPLGNAHSIVAFGSHLDSVPLGPGINDDGSGSAVNLELALQFPGLKVNPINQYQAMWWGSEEEGLIGSRYFVRTANQSGELSNYALYVNMDMLASPNYVMEILDGNTTMQSIRPQSLKITQLYEDFFDRQGIPWQLSAMTGGSDFLPFIEAGVPSSGLLTGAGGIKSQAERATFGGLANAPYDPWYVSSFIHSSPCFQCLTSPVIFRSSYHQPCDTVLNINQACLTYTAQASASVLQTLLTQKNLPAFLAGEAD